MGRHAGRADRGRCVRFRAGAPRHPALLCSTHCRDARHLCARACDPRKRARAHRRPLYLRPGADRRVADHRRCAGLQMAACHRHCHHLGHGRQLSAADADIVRTARPRGAREPFSGARFRYLHQRYLRHHLHLRRGARRTCRRTDRARVFAVRRSRHPLPHSGFPRGHARRRRHVRGAGRRRGRDRGDECRAAVGRGAGASRRSCLRPCHRFRQVPSGRPDCRKEISEPWKRGADTGMVRP